MNKQTHSEETLKRITKGIIGDEDKHKSSTENPEKELLRIISNLYDDLIKLIK